MNSWTGIFLRSDRRPASGLTLVELLAAMAILGGVLVSLMTARHWHIQQWTKARQKQLAVQAADRLLSNWQCSSRVPSERSNRSSSVVSASPDSSSTSLSRSASVNSPVANALSSMPTAARSEPASSTSSPNVVSEPQTMGWAIPCPAQGVIDELGEGWSWRTQLVANPSLQALGGQVVRLEIFPPRTETNAESLVAVEVVLAASSAQEPLR